MVDIKKVTEAKEEAKSKRQLEIEELRKSRVPAGIPQANLVAPEREGYVRRWVCDRPGRLEKLYKGGYRFVKKDDIDEALPQALKVTTRESVDGTVTQAVGSHKSGQEMIAYLMEIPQELYDEDQEVKMAKIDELESTLMKGALPDGSQELTTVKHTPIKMETKFSRHKPKQTGE